MSQVIDSATRALSQTGTQVQKLLIGLPAAVEGLLADIQTNANTIADQEATIAENAKRIDAEVRDQAAEIRLRVKEDSEQVLDQLLSVNGLAKISRVDLVNLRADLENTSQAAAETEFKAVDVAKDALHSKYGNDIAGLKADHKVEIAQLNANAQRDNAMLKALTNQVASLEATIVANREAETARTQALAQSSITVNTTGR